MLLGVFTRLFIVIFSKMKILTLMVYLLFYPGLIENFIILIQSVTISPPNDAISVDFRPMKIQPELLRQTTVAHITFRGEINYNSG